MEYTKLFVLFLFGLFVMTAVARADMALPPTIINVNYNGAPVSGNFSAVVLGCMNSSNITQYGLVKQLNISQYDSAKNCYWTYLMAVQGGCANSECRAYELFPNSGFKLAFYLPSLSKTFISNEVNNSNSSSVTFDYSAALYPDGTALVTVEPGPQPGPIPIWSEVEATLAALVVTLVIEVAVSFLYLSFIKIKQKKRILLTVVAVNIISVPVVWLVFINLLSALGFLLGEIFAIVFEGYFVYYFNKKTIKLKNAMLMSLIMNVASLVLGLLLIIAVAVFV